jgi:hypothetical protein
VTKAAGPGCTATVTAAEVDNGSSDPDGDAITFSLSPAGPFAVGTTSVVLTVTDSHGASSQCSATVTVTDTEAPTLNVPSAITAEFTDANGAAVVYAVTSSDNCSGVMQSCTPPSGSVFPIGTTTVTCTAVDLAGNSTTKTFPVTVAGALGVELRVLADLMRYRATVTDAQVANALDRAISDLQLSLDPANWIDQTHIRSGNVFQQEKDAVVQLINVIRKLGGNATLQSIVDRIVKSKRLLCTVAINDAAAAEAANTKGYAQAVSLRADGDQAIANGQYESGLEAYRNSWSKAVASH